MDKSPETPDEPSVPDEPSLPEEPSIPDEPDNPGGTAADEPVSSGDPPPIPPAPPAATSPYGPAGASDQPAAPWVPNPYGPPPGQPQPAFAAAPDGVAPQDPRPGIGAGVGTGCGLQVLGFLILLGTLGFVSSIWGFLWPFIVITVLAGLLMISRRWRRFATGILIVSAATWIIVLGPCIGLMGGFAG